MSDSRKSRIAKGIIAADARDELVKFVKDHLPGGRYDGTVNWGATGIAFRTPSPKPGDEWKSGEMLDAEHMEGQAGLAEWGIDMSNAKYDPAGMSKNVREQADDPSTTLLSLRHAGQQILRAYEKQGQEPPSVPALLKKASGERGEGQVTIKSGELIPEGMYFGNMVDDSRPEEFRKNPESLQVLSATVGFWGDYAETDDEKMDIKQYERGNGSLPPQVVERALTDADITTRLHIDGVVVVGGKQSQYSAEAYIELPKYPELVKGDHTVKVVPAEVLDYFPDPGFAFYNVSEGGQSLPNGTEKDYPDLAQAIAEYVYSMEGSPVENLVGEVPPAIMQKDRIGFSLV